MSGLKRVLFVIVFVGLLLSLTILALAEAEPTGNSYLGTSTHTYLQTAYVDDVASDTILEGDSIPLADGDNHELNEDWWYNNPSTPKSDVDSR